MDMYMCILYGMAVENAHFYVSWNAESMRKSDINLLSKVQVRTADRSFVTMVLGSRIAQIR